MNWHLVTYADDKNFGDLGPKQQEFVHKIHEKDFIHHPYRRTWLETTDFYEKNKEILNHKESGGLWAWKPYSILNSFEKAEDGDFVVYCDRKDMFSPGLKNYVIENIGEDICLLLVGDNLNRQYTKRDCFILMDCDSEDYWNSKQLEAGFMVWKVCDESIRIINDWLSFCLNYKVNSDSPSELGEEFPDFKAHRSDQSILTNIAISEGLSVGGPEYRNYIECDYDYWYERNEKFGFNMGREIDSFLLSIKNA